ncbi:hypothetical protein N5F00_17430 [Pseudomonas chengduensis]|nr:hypothetical protein [Pseudomonas chengduensis]MDH1731274.1 hypothetical protein [Pseudomonas chengduensis]
MPKTQPLIHLNKIKQKGSDYIQWSIEYTRKKLNLILFNIEETENAIARLEEEKRKLFITQLNSALRSRNNRKKKTSGPENNKKSAFQVYISPATIRKITNHSKTFSLTKSQYIEKLIAEQISMEEHYRNKQNNMKKQNRSSPTEINPSVVELERKLDRALQEIEYLKEIISTQQASLHEANNQKKNRSPEQQKSTSIAQDVEYFDLDALENSTSKTEIRHFNILRRRKKISRLERPDPITPE